MKSCEEWARDIEAKIETEKMKRKERNIMKKKYLKLGAMAACLVLVIGAAAVIPYVANRNVTTNEPVGTTVATDTPISNTDDNIYEPSDGHGTNKVYQYSAEMVPDYLLVDDNTDISAKLPIYTYAYGIGQGGVLYGALNDTEREMVRNRLTSLLSECYDDFLSENYEFVNEDTTVTVTVDGVRFRADPEGISILTESLEIPEGSLYDDVKSIELISDCIEYLGIVDPIVMNFGANAEEKSRGDYYIFGNGDDVFESTSMKYAIARVDNNGNVSAVFLKEIYFGEKVGSYNTLPYNIALAQIKNKYPEMDTENVKAIIYYKFDYRQVIGADGSYGGDGYYVPCYRFFIGSTEEAITGYAMIDVLMTEFRPGDTIVLE